MSYNNIKTIIIIIYLFYKKTKIPGTTETLVWGPKGLQLIKQVAIIQHKLARSRKTKIKFIVIDVPN